MVTGIKLYLVQHGEACPKEVDPDRALTDQGRDDIDRLGVFLSQAGIRADRVMHSGKLRARQTAERLANDMASGVRPVTCSFINPGDDPRIFVEQSESWADDTLVVGHLPFMAKLVSYLMVEDGHRLLTAFYPGTMVCLERGDDAHWRINWMIRPELLK